MAKQLSISRERISEIQHELHEWSGKQHASKRQILAIVGKLQFCARVVRAGTMFVRRLINCAKKLKNLHHVARLCVETRKDLAWWAECMESHNGVAWFKTQVDPVRAELLFTDASDLGAGMVLGNRWSMFRFAGTHDWMKYKSIQWRELFAVVLALATFGPLLRYRDVLMNIDNQAIQISVAQGKSKEPELMAMIRAIYFYTSIHNITYQTVFVPGAQNHAADACSRLDVDRLRRCVPRAELVMTKPAKFKLDF